MSKLTMIVASSLCLVTLLYVSTLTSTSYDLEPQVDSQEQHNNVVTNSAAKSQEDFLRPRDVETISEDQKIQEATLWRWKYFDEQRPEFLALVEDETLDARLSNIVYSGNSGRFVNVDPHKYNWGYAEINDKLENLAAGGRVNDELCGKELTQMIDLFEETKSLVGAIRQNVAGNSSLRLREKHIRLAKVLDSFGHYDSGLHTGRNLYSGSFEQCEGSQMILDDSRPNRKTAARFCWAKLDLDKHLHLSLKQRVKNKYEQDNQLSVAICLPESCHSLSHHKHKHLIETLLDEQFRLPKSMYVEQHLKLASIYCPPDSDSPWRRLTFSGKLFILFSFVWLLAILYVTFLNDKRRFKYLRGRWTNILGHSLNLRSSWDDFCLRYEQNYGTRVNFDVLNPIRVLGAMTVVLGHALIIRASSGHNITRTYQNIEYDPVIFLTMIGNMFVDTFYVITGIFLVYISMHKFKSRFETSKNIVRDFLLSWFHISASRYVRLVPLYFIAYWFKRSIYIRLGSGPYWDDGFNMETENGACHHESWFTPFTMMAAYLPLSKQCLPQTWSIAGDLFFVLVLTPVTLLFIKRPRIAILISIVLTLVSSSMMLESVRSLDDHLKDDIMNVRIYGLSQVFNLHSFLYTAPHCRMFSFLLGGLAGYLLYLYNDNRIIKDWPKWFKGPITWTAWAMITFVITIPSIFSSLRDSFHKVDGSENDMFAHSTTTLRLVWAFSNAVIMMRMTTDWKDNHLMQNFASSSWKSFARLNYAILLVHMDLLILDIQIKDTTTQFSKYNILSLTAATYMFSCLGALIIHILIENPLNRLIKCSIKTKLQ